MSMTKPPEDCGFWGCVDSSVDWCEANYVVLSFVAEFLNTASSLLITISALVGWHLSRKHHVTARGFEFTLAYLTVSFVGLGSAAFHATLREVPQYLDEVPMLMASAVFIYIMLKSDPRVGDGSPTFDWWLGTTIAVFCGAAIISYVFLKVYVLFFLAYFVAVSFLVLYPVATTSCFRQGENSASAKKHFKTAFVFYNLGFAMWLWEHFRCLEEDDHGHFKPSPNRGWETKIVPFHALWHLFAGLGSTYYVGFLVCMSASQEGLSSSTKPFGACCFHPSDIPDMHATLNHVEITSSLDEFDDDQEECEAV